MDKISAELLKKIRAAVIQKLRAMERFVDNELPDYIMILVANKRTMSHMQKDLSLFLGKHTIEFTQWLFDVVAYLKKCSTKDAPLKFIKTDGNTEKINSDEDADVLDYDLGDQEGDLFGQDDISMSNKPSVSGETAKSKLVPNVLQGAETVNNPIKQQTTQKSAKVFPVQPILRLPPKPEVSSEEKLPSFAADEYDPTKPEYTGSISSVVNFTRKSFPRPPSFQTNKLLLRAVNDATKSVMDSRDVNKYKPTPIKMLSTNLHENNAVFDDNNQFDVNIDSILNMDSNPALNSSDEISNDLIEKESRLNSFEIESVMKYNRTICLSSEESQMSVPGGIAPLDVNRYPEVNTKQEGGRTSPHFIVTLDGVDLTSLKRKFSDDSDESMDVDESFIADEDVDDSPNKKKQKVLERCKYWPSCRNDNCDYHHPNIPCKTFPSCKYGDKCLYAHPKCKFSSRCSKKGCPYAHALKKFQLPLVVPQKPARTRNLRTVCKFYPKCTVKNCAFVHPKLCRFGTKCRTPTCQFTHVSIPPRNQLKWKANTSDYVI